MLDGSSSEIEIKYYLLKQSTYKSRLNDVSCIAGLCVVFEFVWNTQLVKCVQSHGIAEVVAVVIVAHHLAVLLIQVTAALHATNVVITHTTVLVLVVELVTTTAARGTFSRISQNIV